MFGVTHESDLHWVSFDLKENTFTMGSCGYFIIFIVLFCEGTSLYL